MKLYKHDGRRMTVTAWARERGMAAATLQARIHSGWEIDAAITKPVQQRQTNRVPHSQLLSTELKARMAKSQAALTEHLKREMQLFLDSIRAAADIHAEVAAKHLTVTRRAKCEE